MISIESIEFNPLGENTYILYDETKEAVIIDPGCNEDEEKEELDQLILSKGLTIKYLLNTHCHVDHVLGNYHVKEKYQVPLLIHELELPQLRAVKIYAPNYGFYEYQETEPDQFIDEGHQIKFGNSTLEIVFVPGHAPGHIAFYNLQENFCVGGDVLFLSSVGRSDLPGGDHKTLIKSIKEKIMVWPDDVKIHPGHGPVTTIGRERMYNPYIS